MDDKHSQMRPWQTCLVARPFRCFSVRLHVGLDEGGEHAALLLQKRLRLVVLQDVPALHDDHQVGRQDGVHAVLKGGDGTHVEN